MNYKNFPPTDPWIRQGVMQRVTLRACKTWAKQTRPAIIYPESPVEIAKRIPLEVFVNGYRLPLYYRPIAIQPGSRGYVCCERAPTHYGVVEVFPVGVIRKARGE